MLRFIYVVESFQTYKVFSVSVFMIVDEDCQYSDDCFVCFVSFDVLFMGSLRNLFCCRVLISFSCMCI